MMFFSLVLRSLKLEELMQAVKSLKGKSPGPNGCYLELWDIVGPPLLELKKGKYPLNCSS